MSVLRTSALTTDFSAQLERIIGDGDNATITDTTEEFWLKWTDIHSSSIQTEWARYNVTTSFSNIKYDANQTASGTWYISGQPVALAQGTTRRYTLLVKFTLATNAARQFPYEDRTQAAYDSVKSLGAVMASRTDIINQEAEPDITSESSATLVKRLNIHNRWDATKVVRSDDYDIDWAGDENTFFLIDRDRDNKQFIVFELYTDDIDDAVKYARRLSPYNGSTYLPASPYSASNMSIVSGVGAHSTGYRSVGSKRWHSKRVERNNDARLNNDIGFG